MTKSNSILIILKKKELKCVILASPGFYRDQLLEHIIEDAKRDNLKNVLNFKSKFLLVHSTSGFIRSLNGNFILYIFR